MREESERKRKKSWTSENKDGEKRLFSLFLSCFPSSDDEDFERTTKDEVLKPLYYIVGDINSEQMEATVESVDDESIDKKVQLDKSFRQSQPRRLDTLSRFVRGILNRCEKNRKTDNTSIGLATRMNETERNDNSSSGQPETTDKLSSKKPSNYLYQARRILRLPFLYLSNRCSRKRDPSTLGSTIEDSTARVLEINEENTDSADTLLLRPATLGVTFAHPVYTGKCRLLTDDARVDTTNHLWTRMRTDRSVDVDEYSIPPTKTIVETTTAESWGSVGSSSLYPTDEQSQGDGNLYYGSFDSDDDIPFDEIFTDTSFFELDQQS